MRIEELRTGQSIIDSTWSELREMERRQEERVKAAEAGAHSNAKSVDAGMQTLPLKPALPTALAPLFENVEIPIGNPAEPVLKG